MLGLISIIFLLYLILSYNIYTMKTMISAKNEEGIKQSFDNINKLTYIIIILSFITFIVNMFKPFRRHSPYKMVSCATMIVSIFLFVFVRQLGTSVELAGNAPVPISFISMKFNMVETLVYTFTVFIFVSTIFAFASMKNNKVSEKIRQMANVISPDSDYRKK